MRSVPRSWLPGTDRGSDSTGAGEHRWCAMVERRVWTMVVVVMVPEIQLTTRVGQREAHLHIETLVAELAAKAFDISVLDRTPRADEVQG